MKSTSTYRAAGFTLIELLVVIAILAANKWRDGNFISLKFNGSTQTAPNASTTGNPDAVWLMTHATAVK